MNMKNTLITIFIISFAVLMSTCNNLPSDSNAQKKLDDMFGLNVYSAKNKETSVPKVVFMGNSITQGWASVHPDFFISNNYVGRGISGQTSSQLLMRLRQDAIELKPEVIVINVGVNDIAENNGSYNATFTLGNIKSMAEIAESNGIKVILTSVLPADRIDWNSSITNVPQKIDSLNVEIKRYAEIKGFEYTDYNSALRDEKGGLKQEYQNDAVHPNEKAYFVMEGVIQESIANILYNNK